MRTVSIFLALTFAATAASAQSDKPAKQGHAQARVPQQHTRSTPAPTPKAAPTAKATPTAKAAPHVASAAPATEPSPDGEPVPASTATAATAATVAAANAPGAPAPAVPASTEPAATTTEPAPASATPAPAVAAAASDDDDDAEASEPAEPAVRIALPAKPPTVGALTIEYQRVGRDILKLQDQRGFFDCGNLQQRFKAIKLEAALATPASRMQLYVTLTELAMKIERMRGIKLDSACLANPLAAGCM